MLPKVRVFIIAYGEAFIAQLCTVTLPSLLQPGNLCALTDRHPVEIAIYTKPDSAEAMRTALESFIEAFERTRGSTPDLRAMLKVHVRPEDKVFAGAVKENPNLYHNLHQRSWQGAALRAEIAVCLREDAIMMLVTADTFFGNGSIGMLIDTCVEQSACVMGLQIRVRRDPFLTLLAAEILPIANDRLVSMCLESVHEAWRTSMSGAKPNLAFLHGHSIAQRNDRLFAVRHRLPNVFAARFVPSDLAYFTLRGDLREWDGTWPQKLLAERRLVVLGSSDLAFCVELTEPGKSTLQPQYRALREIAHLVDARDYSRYHAHNELMGHFVFSLRADRPVHLDPLDEPVA